MSELLIEGLALELQPLVRELLHRAKLEGLDTVIPATGGKRTEVEQMRLFAKGRHHDSTGRWVYDDPQTLHGVVTKALPKDAPHCRAGAVDVELIERGRALGLERWLPAEERGRQLALYSKLGRIGEDLGLRWGGSWHDYCHFELKDWRALPFA